MKLYNLGSNKVEITTDNKRVLFSYNTPVAAWISGRGYVKTEYKWSVTTSKHINMWLRDNGCDNPEVEPQEFFDHLLD